MELHCPDLFRQQAFVAGHWCEADKGARTDIANPATHERLGSVPNMGADEARRAIEAARVAQQQWRQRCHSTTRTSPEITTKTTYVRVSSLQFTSLAIEISYPT